MTAAFVAVVVFAFVAAGQVGAAATPRASDPGVATASARNFEEKLTMRVTKADGLGMSAKGSASGTIDGKVAFTFRVLNGSKGRASFSGSNAHGTLHGVGVATFRVSGGMSLFNGTIRTLQGTGKYSGARSLGISLKGALNRRTQEMSLTLTGKWDV